MARTTTMPRPGRRRGTPSSAALVFKYHELERRFDRNSEQVFADQAAVLREKIERIRAGDDPDYKEALEDLEEKRDGELLSLKLWRDYLLGKLSKDHVATIMNIDDTHTAATKATHDRLIAKIESQAKRLRDDRSVSDISAEGGLEDFESVLDDAQTSGLANGGQGGQSDKGNGTVSRRSRREAAAAVTSYNTPGSGSDSTSDIATSGAGTGASTGGRNTRQTPNLSLMVDLDLASGDMSTITSGRNKQPSKYLTSLKQDEMAQDLIALRKALK